MSDEFSFEAIPYVLPTQNLFGRNILKVYFKFMIFTNRWNGYGASEASAAGDRGDAGDVGDCIDGVDGGDDVDGVDAANRGDAGDGVDGGDDVASPPAPKRKRGRPRIRHKMSPKRRAMSDITKKKISESSRKFTICKGRAHLILLFH